MDSLYLPPTTVMPDGQTVRFGSDANLTVFFAEEPLLNPIKSKEAGRPIFDRIEIVHIQQPGERDNIHRAATDADRVRFADHYARFKQGAVGEKQMPSGTPIDLLFPNNIEIPPQLKYLKIFTVEQMAHLPDGALEKIGMGARQWQNQARAYLAYADKGRGYHELDAKIEALTTAAAVKDTQIASLIATVRSLEATMQKQTAVLPQPAMVQMPRAGEQVMTMPQPDGLERSEAIYGSRVVAGADPLAASGFDMNEFDRLRDEPRTDDAQDEIAEADVGDPQPIKRGPGRPRIHPRPSEFGG